MSISSSSSKMDGLTMTGFQLQNPMNNEGTIKQDLQSILNKLSETRKLQVQMHCESSKAVCWNRDRFDYEKSEDFICVICHDVIKDAYICPCGHVFGKNCIKGWLDKDNSGCPTCRAPCKFEDLIPDINLDELISTLEVICSCNGCHQKVALHGIDHHENDSIAHRISVCEACDKEVAYSSQHLHQRVFLCKCGDMLQACKISTHVHYICELCDGSISEKDGPSHVNVCPNRLVSCDHCDNLVEISQLFQHTEFIHCDLCQSGYYSCQSDSHEIYSCKNMCNINAKYCINTLQGHLQNCPLEIVSCSFTEILGCSFKSQRNSIKQHELDLNFHIMHSSNQISLLQGQINNLKSENYILKAVSINNGKSHEIEDNEFRGFKELIEVEKRIDQRSHSFCFSSNNRDRCCSFFC